MKFMIRSDIEGVTGVTTYQQAENSEFGRRMLMNDLNACIKGLLADGEHEIVIYDEHTDGRNVVIDDLPDCVNVICGKPLYRPDWGGIDSSYDAMIMVGFHARAGVKGALLPHSYCHENLNIYINKTVVGEIGMEAAVAGDFDVPLWLVTGDSAGMAEAEQIVPGVNTVTVKEAIGRFQARCYPPEFTAKKICEASKDIIKNPPRVKPLKFAGPIDLQINLAESDFAKKLKGSFPNLFTNEHTILIKADTVTEGWSKYCTIQKEVRNE
ncbi:MAG: M55 family metallopeptidase [Planctomycetota bacterium]|jgi:D-amino peptidase